MTPSKADHLRIIATGSVSANERPSHARVLCVDDELTVLESLERILRTRFAVDKAASAQDAEEALRFGGAYAVVISDLRLTGTDGLALLSRFRQASPDTVRLLITGFADMDSAIDAIDDGLVFAFIRKPCRADALLERVSDAVHHHQLLSVERTMAEQTMRGAIEMMNRLLAAKSGASAARAARLAPIARAAAKALDLPPADIELAALASQLGALTIDPALADRIATGAPLSEAEREIAAGLPAATADLLAPMPRAQAIQALLRAESRTGVPGEESNVVGANILRAVFDFDDLRSRGNDTRAALASMRATVGVLEPRVIDAVASAVDEHGAEPPRFDLTPRSVRRVAS